MVFKFSAFRATVSVPLECQLEFRIGLRWKRQKSQVSDETYGYGKLSYCSLLKMVLGEFD
jgi:hypothetical protein